MDENPAVRTLCVLPRSAAFELVNTGCYHAPAPFTLRLNGCDAGRFDTNVFTLHGLQPDMLYTAVLRDETGEQRFHFRTPAEGPVLDVRLFGADPAGGRVSTAALTAAVAACPPGGTVLVPAGQYRTGPLFLKSDMTLYLEEGAVLRALPDRTAFPILPGVVPQPDGSELNLGTWEGNPLDCFAALVTAMGARRLTIAGPGTLDGGGAEGDWWENHGLRRGAWRPRTLFLNRCSAVTVLGVTVQNSPSWTVHPYYSEDLRFLGITIQNPADSPNTDGLNPESCRDVLVAGARISVGDDCIAIKSGKRYMGKYYTAPSRNLTIRNCLMERGHGAVVAGSEIAGGVRGVLVQQCLLRGTDRGLRIKTRRGRGQESVVDDITYDNVVMEDVQVPFTANMFYHWDPDGHSDYVQSRAPLPVDDMTPAIGRLVFRRVRCTGCGPAGAYLLGLPERPIGEAVLEEVLFRFAADPFEEEPVMADGVAPAAGLCLYAGNVGRLVLRNCRAEGAKAPPVTENVESIEGEVALL